MKINKNIRPRVKTNGYRSEWPALKVRNDRYRKARGGTSVFLQLICSKCETEVAIYQKDGPGSLLRCYFNRFFWPDYLTKLGERPDPKGGTQTTWTCPNCSFNLGSRTSHVDGRSAYRLVRGAIKKKKI